MASVKQIQVTFDCAPRRVLMQDVEGNEFCLD
jgi:hypothetical protein